MKTSAVCTKNLESTCGCNVATAFAIADLCVAELARHLANDSSFPHEIGLFLGYPVRDVLGFMKSPEEGVMYTGFWKVYGDKDEALRTFARYRKCTEVYCKCYRTGSRLDKLAVAER